MNTNKKELAIVKRAKKTLVGRCVCRLMGEESGQAMMEYVIIAVLIAAAVAIGAWFFGKDIMNMFGVAGRAGTGDNEGAIQMQTDAQDGAIQGQGVATQAWKEKNTDNRKDAGDVE